MNKEMELNNYNFWNSLKGNVLEIYAAGGTERGLTFNGVEISDIFVDPVNNSMILKLVNSEEAIKQYGEKTVLLNTSRIYNAYVK